MVSMILVLTAPQKQQELRPTRTPALITDCASVQQGCPIFPAVVHELGAHELVGGVVSIRSVIAMLVVTKRRVSASVSYPIRPIT